MSGSLLWCYEDRARWAPHDYCCAQNRLDLEWESSFFATGSRFAPDRQRLTVSKIYIVRRYILHSFACIVPGRTLAFISLPDDIEKDIAGESGGPEPAYFQRLIEDLGWLGQLSEMEKARLWAISRLASSFCVSPARNLLFFVPV